MIEFGCEVCNRVVLEEESILELNNPNRHKLPLHCDSCAKKRDARFAYVDGKVRAYKGRMGFFGRLIVGWNAQSEFEELWKTGGARVQRKNPGPDHYNCRCTMTPVMDYVWKTAPDARTTRQQHTPMPEVKPPKVDKPVNGDLSALAEVLSRGFDMAADGSRDVTMELTYRRVGDVVDADGKIEVLNVREIVAGPTPGHAVTSYDVSELLERADRALDDEVLDDEVLSAPMSMGGVPDELMAEANAVFGKVRESAGSSSMANFYNEAKDAQLAELGYFWLLLKHAVNNRPGIDIRTNYGADELYKDVRALMVKREIQ